MRFIIPILSLNQIYFAFEREFFLYFVYFGSFEEELYNNNKMYKQKSDNIIRKSK